jgi:carbonic anhydrase/acetyltransferase-like protein (isoleucine patch superfamily)
VTLRAYLGFLPVLGTGAWVDPSALVIGQVTLGEDASVWPFAVLRGDINTIKVGARSNVQDGCVLHVVHDGPYCPGGLCLQVGADVTIGHKAVVHAATVGDRCLIGMGAIVTDGAVIEDDVIVGAGSVVAPGKRLASGGLYLGSPARRVRDLTAREREQIPYTAAHYVKVKDNYRRGGP